MTTAKKAAAKAAATKRTKAGLAVESEIMEVTPALATEWLGDTNINRNLRPKVVAAYRRDMEHGRWEFTGEAIQRSVSGSLLNGQHRLHALAEAEGVESIQMLVVTGLPEKSQTLMDQGVARSFRDAMVMEHGHVKNITTVASICRWLVLCPEAGKMNPSVMRNKISAAEAVDKFGEAPEVITRAGEEATLMRRYMLGSPTATGYAFTQFFQVDAADTVEFFAGMRDMEWSMPNDPRKAALRRMQLMHGDEGIKTTIETGVMMVSVLSRAWNLWRKKEEIESLNIRSKNGIILPVDPI